MRRARSVAAACLAGCAVLAAGGAAQPGTPERAEGYVNFSFDQVEVGAFVKLVGDLTGRKFVLSEGVRGRITVVSPQINREEVYPLFVSILESVGCSVVDDGRIARVVALPEAGGLMAPVVGVDELVPRQGVFTKVLRLEHVTAGELKKLLEDRVTGGKTGGVGAVDETNHLVLTDTAENIRRVEKIVAEVDRPGLARVTKVVPLTYIGADELAEQLSLAIAEREGREGELLRRLPRAPGRTETGRRAPAVVASPHSNSIILVGTPSDIEALSHLVAQMDVDTAVGRGRLNAIFLKYLSAAEAAKSITALLSGSTGEGKQGAAAERKIAIEASEANNALLIDAGPGDFDVVRKLVEQLDRAPEQVHIAVMIAEVSVVDELDLGVEMAALNLPSEVGSTVVQGSTRFSEGADGLMNSIQNGIFPRGLTVGVAHGTRLDDEGNVVAGYPGFISVDAVKKDSRFKILSETSLEAQNNREASVSIVNEIPILRSTIQGGSGTARDVIQNIERVDVGIKLALTPHVIPDGQVRMVLNPRIEAVIDPGPTGTQYTPTIAKREVSTTVIVPDGRTIVIAGLTREDRTKSVKKIPLLGDLPLLGWLFRDTVDSTEKTNLLIFVTPRIVGDIAAAERVREDWEQKTGLPEDDDD